MNQKRFSNSKKSRTTKNSSRLDIADKQVDLDELLGVNRVVEPTPDLHQSTPLTGLLRSQGRDSSRSPWRRGFFWGSLVSLISISSALMGMALTKIELVERQISAQLQNNPAPLTETEPEALLAPRQVLLVEVESDADAMVEFDPAATGKSKTLLLLEVDPELNFARVINIPMNTKAKIPGFGMGTVDDAYALGGMELLSQTVNGLNKDFDLDRYLRASEAIFQQLTASGRINLKRCDRRISDCHNLAEQLIRQETALKTIRQRFNIPTYLANFQTTVERVESQWDSNISTEEILKIANFVRELEPERLNVELIPNYVPGRTLASDEHVADFDAIDKTSNKILELEQDIPRANPWANIAIAVQNTTDRPELGRRVVAYLRHHNFRDVYLVPQIPLKLEQTKIVADREGTETASYLQDVLGFGNLDSESAVAGQELVLQLGEDATYLPRNYPGDR